MATPLVLGSAAVFSFSFFDIFCVGYMPCLSYAVSNVVVLVVQQLGVGTAEATGALPPAMLKQRGESVF